MLSLNSIRDTVVAQQNQNGVEENRNTINRYPIFFPYTSVCRFTFHRSGENGWRIPASDGPIGHDTEKKDVPVLAPDPWNTLKDETVLAG